MTTSMIPGPKGKPYFGIATDIIDDFLGTLNELATTYGDIVQFKIFGRTFYLIRNPDDVREVLVTKAKQFPKGGRDIGIMRKMIGNGLVTNVDQSSHKRQRKFAQPAFHHKRIANYAETMGQYSAEMVDTWQDGMKLDASDAMYELTMYIVSKTLFDADKAEMAAGADKIAKAIHNLQTIANTDFDLPFLIPTWLPTKRSRLYNESKHTLDSTIEAIITKRRASAVDGVVEDKGDLLSMLMMAQDEDGNHMEDQQLRDEVITLFVAGHETTSNALTWTWYLLSQHPEVVAKLEAELDTVLQGRPPTLADLPQLTYTKQIINESMRLYPPAHGLNSRQATKGAKIGNTVLPKDGNIFIFPHVLHRNPKYFDRPEQFDPERWTPEFEAQLPKYAYIPFGGGPRVCIGNAFAMMEAQLVIATIAQRFRLHLEPNQTVEPNPLITLSVKNGLKMSAHERRTIKSDAIVESELPVG